MSSFTLFIILTGLTIFGCSPEQTTGKTGIPQAEFILSSESILWNVNRPATVKISIENVDKEHDYIILSSNINFYFTDVIQEAVNKKNAAFWSPVSLTKTYDADKNSCQDDLTEDRIFYSKNGKRDGILPPKGEVRLMKNEKKEFTFNLNRMCWAHEISNVYPSQDLFSLIDNYPPVKGKKYKVYFEMGFKTGTAHYGGTEIPLSKTLRSNVIEITVE